MFVSFLYLGQTDIVCRQQGEYISLKACHQQFETVHKHGEQYRNDCHCAIDGCPHRCGDEYQASQCQDNRMPCHNVGKQTDHQGEWLGEYAEELHKGYDRQG